MEIWGQLDENLICINTLVIDEIDAERWLIENFGGVWVSVTEFPAIGCKYNPGTKLLEGIDAPHTSWVWDNSTHSFIPPTPRPDGDPMQWIWDEDSLSWIER